MNVLSLFDGMSCGQIALQKRGIKYKNYFASEIKPYAITVTQHNFPKTIQLGDITKLKATSLPKIDLLIGGSPCQNFSIASSSRTGLRGEKSSLFFEFLRLKNALKPKYWLFENVKMKESDYKAVCKHLRAIPVRINSSLVSAQLRDRFYWTNIGQGHFDKKGYWVSTIPQPKDKKIKLQSILEHGYTDREKSRAILQSDSRGTRKFESMWHRYNDTGFSTIIYNSPDFDQRNGIRYFNQRELERLQTVPEGTTKIVTKNEAASLLGDGWTIDVIIHILSQGKF